MTPVGIANALNHSAHFAEWAEVELRQEISGYYEISADLHHVPYRAVKAFLAPGQLNGSDHRTRVERQAFAQPKRAIDLRFRICQNGKRQFEFPREFRRRRRRRSLRRSVPGTQGASAATATRDIFKAVNRDGG